MLQTEIKRMKRKRKIRSKINGDSSRPRLVVFRSNKHIYAQIIDDVAGKTLLSVSDKEARHQGKSIKIHEELGKIIADKAVKSKINTVVFDRNGYKFHGRIKTFVDTCRTNGLKF